jgi:hypothetical protein
MKGSTSYKQWSSLKVFCGQSLIVLPTYLNAGEKGRGRVDFGMDSELQNQFKWTSQATPHRATDCAEPQQDHTRH